jgi:hypothetical protein
MSLTTCIRLTSLKANIRFYWRLLRKA